MLQFVDVRNFACKSYENSHKIFKTAKNGLMFCSLICNSVSSLHVFSQKNDRKVTSLYDVRCGSYTKRMKIEPREAYVLFALSALKRAED